jgi:hypothetical protein
MNNLFDDIIKQSVEGHEAPVPAAVWEKISGKKKKRRYIFFWLLFAFLVVGSGSIFLWKKTNSNEGKIIAERKDLRNENTVPNTDTVPARLSVKEEHSPLVKSVAADTVASDNNNSSVKKIPDSANADNDARKITGSQKARMAMQVQSGSADNDITGSNRKRKHRDANAKVAVKITSPETEVANKGNSADEPLVNNTTITSEPTQVASMTNPTEIKRDSAKTAIAKVIKEDSLKTPSTTSNQQPKEKKYSGKWQVEISATPMLSFQEYSNPLFLQRTIIGAGSRDVFTANKIKTSLEPSVAYTASIVKELNKKLAIGAGLQYIHLKEKISLYGTDTTTNFNIVKRLVSDPVAPFLIDDTVSVITTGNRNINAQNNYTYINIPVFAQYQIAAKKKWALAVRGGINFNIKTTYKNEIQGSWIRKYATGDELPGNKINVGISFFGGMKGSLQIRKKTELFVMPAFTYNPRTYNIKNAVLNKRISFAGISAGVSFQIK